MRVVFSVSLDMELAHEFKEMIAAQGGGMSGHIAAAMRDYLEKRRGSGKDGAELIKQFEDARDAAQADPAKKSSKIIPLRELFEGIQNPDDKNPLS